jgi:predicted metal-dependent hydrolase
MRRDGESAEQPSQLHVRYGREVIVFTLRFQERQRLSISVHPDKKVTVAAPKGRSVEEVLARVRRRALWIVRQLDHFDRLQPLPTSRRYFSGETHLYLGRQYRLKVDESADSESVKLQGKYVHVRTPDRDSARVQDLVDAWYREHAHAVFARRLEVCQEATKRILHIKRPEFSLRRMPTRWGSCTRAGKLLLNPDLIKAPLLCIDYVVTHELCHVKMLHHGPDFRRLLSRRMPDWELRKARLDSFAW